ncbi:MAG: hypothetical protein U0529_04360 [Thermoanaerobaculia bacterium]
MNAARLSAAFFGLVFSAASLAGDEVPPTPAATPQSAPQHVTAPSLPGQPNREGTVKPDGGMPMDSEGYAITKRYDPSATPQAAPKPGAKPAAAPAGASAPGAPAPGSAAAPAASIPVGPAPTGKAVATGANTATIRGNLVAVEPGKSVTIRIQRTGVDNTYTLKEGAKVAADLKPGQLVRVRVLPAEKGKVADRVEAVPPPKPTAAAKENQP